MNATLYLKSCSNCGGDMCQDKDRYGAYRVCLQCGFGYDLVKESLEGVQADVQAPDLERKAV